LVFSAPSFLYFFLPLVLLCHHFAPTRWRNLVLLVASLGFYAHGEGVYTLVMLASIVLNWGMALRIENRRNRGLPTAAATALAVAANLAMLGVFKYADFGVRNLSAVTSALGLGTLETPGIHLPIGVSFFTFQALSYVLDVARGEVPAARNPLDIALYVSLFPQLIAGPIVRYETVAAEIRQRSVGRRGFASGVTRFVAGLAKKVLVADMVARTADTAFSRPGTELEPSVAWLGLLCYAIQIYFDFSGYSDMAIGMGRMLGFRFLENFTHPYAAATVTEFWRRWHISLSTWFRDYLYVPLGGNRGSPGRTYRNLFLVFLLCGLWHGASWNFIAWGLFHGLFLVLERSTGLAGTSKRRLPLRVYTLAVVLAGWVLFRCDTLPHAATYFAALAGASVGVPATLEPVLPPDALAALCAGILLSFPVLPGIRRGVARFLLEVRESARRSRSALAHAGTALAVFALLVLALSQVAASLYSPFIYFRF
jgi:alginate O-acetyltransferase complex protein AlgI